jgi:hypothetical protein
MPYKKFTEDERAMWLLQLEVLNYPKNIHAPTTVSKQRGAPHALTLKRWWKVQNTPKIDKLIEHKKRDVIADLGHLLGLHIDAAIDAVHGNEDLRALDTGIGILVDKLQLLTGNPTERVDTIVRIAENRNVINSDS